MHLLFYSPQSLPSIGGLQYVVHFWAEELVRRGHTVTLLTDTPAEYQPQRGDSTYPGVQPPASHPRHPPAPPPIPPTDPIYSIIRNGTSRQQLRALRAADLVVMFNVSLKGLPILLLSGKPIYVTHHTALWYEDGPRPLRQRIKRWVADRLAKKNCACSAYIASLYKKCDVIHSPYRADHFMPGNQPRIPGSILFVGRLVSDKGADLLLQAAAILQKKGLPFTLTIAGEGPEREQLEKDSGQKPVGSGQSTVGSQQLAVEKDLDKDTPELQTANLPTGRQADKLQTIQFTGSLSQPELVHLMQTHALMVVPSRMEPMGMVVAEGLACGCQMVVARQGGLPEVGGPFCTYFESGNATALADALEQVLTHPPDIDRDALKKHLEQFTIDHSVDKLEAWLKQ